jgi:hypothetical protein
VMHWKYCVGYIGQFMGVWPITATDGGQREYSCSEPQGVKISKNGPFSEIPLF